MTSSAVKTVYYEIRNTSDDVTRRAAAARYPHVAPYTNTVGYSLELRELTGGRRQQQQRRFDGMASSLVAASQPPSATGNDSVASVGGGGGGFRSSVSFGAEARQHNGVVDDLPEVGGSGRVVVGLNSDELCRLADAQFVDRMKFDRELQATYNGNGGRNDVRSAAVKATGSILAASNVHALTTTTIGSTQKPVASGAIGEIMSTVRTVDATVGGDAAGTGNTSTETADNTTSVRVDRDVTMTSTKTMTTTDVTKSNATTSGCVGGAGSGDETGSIAPQEMTPAAATRRSLLSLYNLRVWPDAESKNDFGGKQFPTRRTEVGSRGERRSNGSGGAGNRRRNATTIASACDDIVALPTELQHRKRTPQQQQQQQQQSNTAIEAPSVDHIRALRHSYPDDPMLRRILGVSLQLSRHHSPSSTHRTLTRNHPTFMVHPRLRTGSRQCANNVNESPSDGLQVSGGDDPVARSAGGRCTVSQRDSRTPRRPSVSLMFERSVTKIEPGWKTETDAAADRRRRGPATAGASGGNVAVVIEDEADDNEDTGSCGGGDRKHKRNCSSAVSTATTAATTATALTPRPPCNSPDQSRDDYFWPTITSSATVFRSGDVRRVTVVDRQRPTAASILSHYEPRRTAADRFQRTRLAASRTAGFGGPAQLQSTTAAQQSMRSCVSGIRIDGDRSRSSSATRFPVSKAEVDGGRLYGGGDVTAGSGRLVGGDSEPEAVPMQSFGPRLVVYVPH